METIKNLYKFSQLIIENSITDLLKKPFKFSLFYSTVLMSNMCYLFKRHESSHNGTLFIENCTIGDFIIKLPFYKEVSKIEDRLYILSNNNTLFPILKLFLPSYNLITINMNDFLYNPLDIQKYKNVLLKFKFKNLVIASPFRPNEHVMVAKLLKAEKKYLYEGESIHEKDYFHYFDNEFLIIKNPYKLSKKVKHIDTHIFNHVSEIFKEVFSIEIENIRESFLNIFSSHKTTTNEKYVVILPEASLNYRKYPRDKWQIILNNLPKDVKIIQIGLNKFPLKHPNLIDLTGKTTLEEAMSIVMNSSLVIGNETGLTHLGYLSGVPTVCILGGGHFGRFLPWKEFDDIVKCVYNKMDCFQCGWRCKYVNLKKGEVPPCIKNIKPEKVIGAINELNERYDIF